MKRLLPVSGVVLGMAAALFCTPTPATAQARVGVRVGVRAPLARRFYYSPYYYDPFYWNAWWYPGFYGYYQYPYPPYYYGRRDSASLKLEVKPRETQVFVDGYYAGTVDDFDGIFQHLDLEPGEHDLQLYLPGYRLQQQRIYLQPNSTFRVRYTMVPLGPGDAEPQRPAPAAAPTTAPAPPQGPVTRGPQRPLPPRQPRPGPPPREAGTPATEYGTLALRVQPSDAEVLVDGEKWETSGDERLLVQLAAGVHHVEARKDGYRIYATDVTVRPGETATLNVALSKQP